MTIISTPKNSSRTTWAPTLKAAGLSAVGSFAVNSAIAWIARNSSNAVEDFEPLSVVAFGPVTVGGAIMGAIGWRLIVDHHRRAGRLLLWLAPVMLALSLIPNVLMLVNGSEPGQTTGRVVALMLMHLAIGIVSIPLYRRFMPPRT